MFSVRRGRLFLLSLWWACCLPMAQANQPPVPGTPGELKAQVEAIMREENVPGVGVALARDGRIVWQAGLGLADVARKTPVTPRTLFRIGDISKCFVALAALKLQEQGRLKLTDTLAQWAPELVLDNPWQATDPVRLVHLLEHTSGLRDMSLAEYARAADATMSIAQAMKLGQADWAARWRPGSRAAHSSIGPALVAQVVEKVSGQRFEDYVRSTLFLPIGMTSATYIEPRSDFAGQYAVDGVTPLPYWNDIYRPAAAVNASVDDMASFLLFLVRRGEASGERVVSAAAIERMERPETLPMVALGVNIAPALGMLNTIEDGVHFRGHFGIVNGGLSELLYVPETRSGVVIMMNSLNEGARMRMLDLFKRVLAQGVVPAAAAQAADVDPQLLAHHGGFYVDDSPATERLRFIGDMTSVMHVSFSANGMLAHSIVHGYTEEWIAQTGRTFRQEGMPGAMLAMYRAQDGEIVMQSKWGTLRRVSAVRALAPLLLAVLSLSLMLSAVAVAAVWLVRRAVARWRWQLPGSTILLPAAACVLLLLVADLVAGAQTIASLWGPWGSPTPIAIAVFAAGLVFLVLSLASAWAVHRQRAAPMRRFTYAYLVAASLACVVTAVALVGWRVIGIPIWIQ